MNKRERIKELAKEGYSQSEIARILGYSRSYVNLIKKQENLSFADGNKKRLDLERNKAILWDYLSGRFSFAELGRKYGINAPAAFIAASNLIPCRPLQAKRLLISGKSQQMSVKQIKTFFETLEALYGKAYRDLVNQLTRKRVDTD